MEGIALKLAGEAAVPAATYVYETLKNQTGRAKFEKGKANLQDGFALLRDGKAGGLLPARERVELLQTHAELVANRENVEEITHTLYGSLAHRHTAKEFESRAKQFRKNVETPAEKAQMEYELRKAKLEMAAERSPSSKDPHISQNQRDASASKFSPVDAHLKPAVGLSRSPTTIDYPISSQSRQIRTTKVIPNQRTASEPIQQTRSSSPHCLTVRGVSGPPPNLHHSRSRNALSNGPARPPSPSSSKTLPANMERPNDHHAGSLPTINASKSRETHAQRFRSNTRPLPTREATYPPVSRRANQTQDIGSLHNNLKVPTGNVSSDGLRRNLKQIHSRLDLSGSYSIPTDGHRDFPPVQTGHQPAALQSQQPQVHSGPRQDQTLPPYSRDIPQVHTNGINHSMPREASMRGTQNGAEYPPSNSRPMFDHTVRSSDAREACTGQTPYGRHDPHSIPEPNFKPSFPLAAETFGAAVPNQPMFWNINPPESTDIPYRAAVPEACTCLQNRFANPCSNCHNRRQIHAPVVPPRPSFPCAHSTSSWPAESHPSQHHEKCWENRTHQPTQDRGPVIQVEVRLQYPPTNYSGPGFQSYTSM